MLVSLLRPKFWLGHLAMIAAVGLAVGLGMWQLSAWQQHRDDARRDLANEPPVALSSVMDGDDPFPGSSLGRPVELTGTWLGESTLYVADRDLDDRTGYWVVTPVLVPAEGEAQPSAMPVVRGWSSRPEAAAPTGPVQVTGWLQATEGSGPIDDDPSDDVIMMMRTATIVEYVDADLYSGYVVAKEITGEVADATAGLEPVTPDAIPEIAVSTALRNLLYAIEWWIFAGFALFIWVRWCRDELDRTSRPEEAPEPVEAPLR